MRKLFNKSNALIFRLQINLKLSKTTPKNHFRSIKMSYNTASIEQIFEQEEDYIPSEDSSFNYKIYDFDESEKVQIEQQNYGPNRNQGFRNQSQTFKKQPKTFHMDQELMNDDFKSPTAFKRDSSVYAMIGEKDQDLSQSIFSNSNSRNDSDLSSNGKDTLLKKASRRKSTRSNKKDQKRVIKSTKPQSESGSISRPRRNTSSSIRRGKHSQSKTQRFIYFCTQFHYSKNFSQFLKKKIIQKTGKLNNYINSTPAQKTSFLDEIIADIGEYKMAIHYKVQQSIFMASFNLKEKNLIREIFWRVIQKTYKTRLELEKKYIGLIEEEAKPSRKRFFDEKGEIQFNAIFDSLLAEQPFASVLPACNFEEVLEEAMRKMSKKQKF